MVTENVCQLTVLCRKFFFYNLSKSHKFILLSESSKELSQGLLFWEECPVLEFILSYREILPQLVPKLLKTNFRCCLLFKNRRKKKKEEKEDESKDKTNFLNKFNSSGSFKNLDSFSSYSQIAFLFPRVTINYKNLFLYFLDKCISILLPLSIVF